MVVYRGHGVRAGGCVSPGAQPPQLHQDRGGLRLARARQQLSPPHTGHFLICSPVFRIRIRKYPEKLIFHPFLLYNKQKCALFSIMYVQFEEGSGSKIPDFYLRDPDQ